MNDERPVKGRPPSPRAIRAAAVLLAQMLRDLEEQDAAERLSA